MENKDVPQVAKRILGGRGKKMHTHEVQLRRTDNGGYVAKHQLRDKRGNPPMDGQRGEAEYALADKAAMLAHMDKHMGEMEPDNDEGQEEQEG